jgi:lipopolysaccharide export system permease protein
MYVFTRYVVTEILQIFLLTLVGITLLVTVAMGVKEGTSHGFPPLIILHMMPYLLPEMLVITIPVSLLLAVSIVYGRMTGTNEIVALKSLGISPMDVIWPAIVLALLFSIGVLYLQEVAATFGRPSVARVGAQSVKEIAYGMLKKNKSCKLPTFEIVVVDVDLETEMLISPTITMSMATPGTNETIMIQATKAKLVTDWANKSLKIMCWDSRIEYSGQGGVGVSRPGLFERTIPMGEPGRDQFHRDWVAMHEIPDRLAELRKLIWDTEQQRKVVVDSKSTQAEKQPALTHLDNILKDLWWKIFRLRTEPYRRLSNGFTCLCFVLIGAPVAMLWRHADVLTNFFVCFLPILAIYYPLLMIGEDLTTSRGLVPILFWMGNVILIIPGILLLKWVVRH